MPERRRSPALSREEAPQLSRPKVRAGGVQHLVQLLGNRAAAALLQARGAAPPSRRVPPALTALGGPVLQRATWADYGLDRQVAGARARIAFTDDQDLLFALPEREKAQLRSRIEIALYRLELGLKNDWLGESHDLSAKIGGLLRSKPDKKEKDRTPAEVLAKKISEDLSELEHAADVVLRHGPQDIAVSKVHVGAKGPQEEGAQLPPVEKAGIRGFEQQGALPPIDEPQLQADTYYRSGDGYVHVVEVKDSVNALRTKLAEARQYERQKRWLERRKRNRDYLGVVEYFIQDPTPFHRLLDRRVLEPFDEIEKAQFAKGHDWIKLGDEKFTFPAFKALYDQAMAAFDGYTESHKAFWKPKDHTGPFLDRFFGTKALARATIANPQIMEAFTG